MEPYTDGNIRGVSVKPGIGEDPVGSEFEHSMFNFCLLARIV